jgi:6-pyruvoyltetrahydropterin/6-carboxytetrahydropterin synthase
MTYTISQKFFFDAAHTLRRKIETESSLRIHGHTYYAEVFLSGTPDPVTGMVVDLGFVRLEVEQLRQQLDHHLLDEVPGLGPATLENLCRYIHQHMLARLPAVSRVRVWRDSIGDSCTLDTPAA